MGRPRKTYEEKKHTITVSLPGWIVLKLKEKGKYSNLIEVLLKEYFAKGGK